MKMQKPHGFSDLPPRAFRRNRLLLAAFGTAACLSMAAATIISSAGANGSAPLLTVVDEVQRDVAVSPEITMEIAPVEAAPFQTPVSFSVEESVVLPAPVDPSIRYFNGRPVRPAKSIIMEVTGYSPDSRSCGKFADGITASGYSVWTNGMHLAAADTSILPFGSMISVPGYDQGAVIPVLDRGGAIKGNRIDLLYPTHEEALKWGRKRVEVTIWEYADGKPADFVPRYR